MSVRAARYAEKLKVTLCLCAHNLQVEAYREKLIASKEYQWVNFREQKYLMRLQYEAGEMAKLTH